MLPSEDGGHQSKRRCNTIAKISGNYEVVYIIDPALGEEAIAAPVEKFKALTEQHGCSAVEVEEWGKRKLAYAID